jgi:hypothetical protein
MNTEFLIKSLQHNSEESIPTPPSVFNENF